jgi:hypothetical protein
MRLEALRLAYAREYRSFVAMDEHEPNDGCWLPPQSAEALAQLARLPPGATDALQEYLHGDYLILYTLAESTVYLLSIRHHRQLTYDFARLWPSPAPSPSDADPGKKAPR